MRLDSVAITRNSYGPREGQYECIVTYQGDYGSAVKLQLQPEMTKRVLALVAEEMVRATQQVATDLTAEIIRADQQLPAPSEPSVIL